MVSLDASALTKASRALQQRLEAEAASQRAYLHHFYDGRISLELEWIDLTELARVAVDAYVEALAGEAHKRD